MPKKTLLPPSNAANKREVSVNLRFSVEDHARLKQVADHSGTTVATLLHYVTINTTLPLMEQEVRRVHTEERIPNPLARPIETASRQDAVPLTVPDEDKA